MGSVGAGSVGAGSVGAGAGLTFFAFLLAFTHWLKGVPFSPFTCFLLTPWQRLPLALA